MLPVSYIMIGKLVECLNLIMSLWRMKMPYSDPDKQREYQRKWMQREGRSKPAIGTKRFSIRLVLN